MKEVIKSVLFMGIMIVGCQCYAPEPTSQQLPKPAVQALVSMVGSLIRKNRFATFILLTALYSMKTELISECAMWKFVHFTGAAFMGLSGLALYRTWQWKKSLSRVFTEAQMTPATKYVKDRAYPSLIGGALAFAGGAYLYDDNVCSQLT